MSNKKQSRAERKQIRAKAARLRAHPSGTAAAADRSAGDEPAQAQIVRAAAASSRAELARAASRDQRLAKHKTRTERTERTEPQEREEREEREERAAPASERKPWLSRFTGGLTRGKNRGEHAVLVFLALVVLAAVIVFVAQRGRTVNMVTETPGSGEEAAQDKPAAPVAPSPEPLPPQDDHSPPTIVTAPASPPPAATTSAQPPGAAEHADAVAKPKETKAKAASTPAKPKKPPSRPAEDEVY